MISVFKYSDLEFVRYLGSDDKSEDGGAWIARLVGRSNSNSVGGGLVRYERVTVDWDLPFDEVITVLEGQMRVRSGGRTFDLSTGSPVWFPARTPLTYEVSDRVVVSYAIYPLAS